MINQLMKEKADLESKLEKINENINEELSYCSSCQYSNKYDHYEYYCLNPESDHFHHFITAHHKKCNLFCTKSK